MSPADTYNSKGNIKEIKKTVGNHRNLGTDLTGLLLFGSGDGGGGNHAAAIKYNLSQQKRETPTSG